MHIGLRWREMVNNCDKILKGIILIQSVSPQSHSISGNVRGGGECHEEMTFYIINHFRSGDMGIFILIHCGDRYSSGFFKHIFTVNNISSAYHLAVSVLCVRVCVVSMHDIPWTRIMPLSSIHRTMSICHVLVRTLPRTERVRVPLSLYFSILRIRHRSINRHQLT
jgi:hypothetical protein